MKTTTCNRTHTKFQPTAEQWRCPRCGSRDLVIDCDVLEDDTGCELLHPDDSIECIDCTYTATGRSLANALVKKLELEPCACCKGSGYVKKAKP